MSPAINLRRLAAGRKNEMTTLKALRLMSLAGIGTVLAAASSAQDGGYAYGGLSIGQSQARIDEARISSALLASGLTTAAMTRDESDTAYKLFVGYQLNRYVALEAGYFNLGKFGFTSSTVPSGTLDGRIKLQGLNLDLVGTLPLSDRWSAIGRVGGQYARARDTFTGSGAVNVLNPNPSERGAGYKAGLGLQYEVSPSFLLRAEAERYRIKDGVGNRGDVNLYSVSLVVPFGRTAAAAPRAVAMAAPPYVAPPPAPVAPPPAPVAAPPPPPPVIVAAPAPAPVVAAPERRRVSFSADSLFAFDKAELRSEGRSSLDKFAQESRGAQYGVITVEGHTDRLGSEAYNQRLSARRAEAVKAYLVGPAAIEAAKISAVGKGEAMPVTKPGDCKGTSPSAKLIACLQPDRRVVVEVEGTR